MDFLVSIDDERGKSLIAFLKKLDFVVLRPFKKKAARNSISDKPLAQPAYFNACPDWDVDAGQLRKSASPVRRL